MVTAHNMTRAIQKLEKNGLLKRAVDKKDARVNRVVITAKGSHLLDEAWPGYDKNLKTLADKLPLSGQKSLARLLQEWLNSK
jgi:DNA-binding MarR family transcriptional regulator